MKKYLLLILLLLMIPIFVRAEEHTYLYDVIKNEAQTGTYAKEYTGEHNDTIGGGNSKIYYFYSENTTNQAAVQNKWNVLFGGFCWEAYRTTDGGGTKLIYNGIPVNGTCKDDRTFPFEEFESTEEYNITREFTIGSSYHYDTSDNTYHLDNTENITINEDNKNSVFGKYACRFYETGTTNCDKLYKFYRLEPYPENSNTGYSYTFLTYQKTAVAADYNIPKYYSIGRYAYSNGVAYPPKTGYMYDDTDLRISSSDMNFGEYTVSMQPITSDKYTVIANNSYVPYSFDDTNNSWNLNTTTSYIASIKFKINEAGNYILRFGTNRDGSYLKIYRNGEIIKDYSKAALSYANKIMELNDVKITDEFQIDFTPRNYNSNELNFHFEFGTKTGEVTDTRVAFSNSVEYKNGKYTLKDIMYTDGTDNIFSHHYTCLTHNTECERVFFAFKVEGVGTTRYVIKGVYLENGKTQEDIIGEFYNKDDINKKDSLMKSMIDKWYENNLTNYSKYLESTSFCNNRSIYNYEYSFLNPNSTDDASPEFYAYSNLYSNHTIPLEQLHIYNTNLYCKNITDQFSLNNAKAKLKYSVGTITAPELEIAGNSNRGEYSPFRKLSEFQTMSPFQGMDVYNAGYNSNLMYERGRYERDVRPVISLKSTVEFNTGTGTKEDPYRISTDLSSNIYKVNDDTKGTLDVDGPLENVKSGTVVTFTVEKNDGFNIKNIKVIDEYNDEVEYTLTDNTYKFTMPTSDVKIVVEYSSVLNILNTLKNMNTALIAIILVIIGYGAYILIKKRK